MQVLRSYHYSQVGGLEKGWEIRKILNKQEQVAFCCFFVQKIKFCDIIYKNMNKEGV